MHRHVRVLESNAHARQIFLRQPNHGLVDVAQNRALDGRMLDDLAQNTTIATANDEHTLWIRMGVECQVGNHLLVAADWETFW